MLPEEPDSEPLTIFEDDWAERAILDFETQDHYETLFQFGPEELYQASRERLPFGEIVSDMREDVASALAMDYVRWQLGRDPGGDLGMWSLERADFAASEFGYHVESDTELLRLLIGKVRDEQASRQAEMKALKEDMIRQLLERPRPNVYVEVGKGVLGGINYSTWNMAQGAYTQIGLGMEKLPPEDFLSDEDQIKQGQLHRIRNFLATQEPEEGEPGNAEGIARVDEQMEKLRQK